MFRSIRVIDVPFYLELEKSSLEVNPAFNEDETSTLISQFLFILGFTFDLNKECAEWTFSESLVLRLWRIKNGKLVIEIRDLSYDDLFKDTYNKMKAYLK